jgi:hypothetical protein
MSFYKKENQDILLDDNDLLIANGDWVIDESTEQHIELLLNSEKGNWLQYPFFGVGISRYINSRGGLNNRVALQKSIRENAKDDGLTLKLLSFILDGNNENIYISGEYKNMNLKSIYTNSERSFDTILKLAIDSKERVKELYEQILEEKLSEPTLAQLTSTSKTAVWRLWTFITSFQIWAMEMKYRIYKEKLDDAAEYAQSHTTAWYQKKATLFQYGDALTVINGAVVYPVIDTTKQIIKAAAVSVTPNATLLIKVAKLDANNDTLVALESSEFDAFKAYVNEFQDAGVLTQVSSQNADVLKLNIIVYYNPLALPLQQFQQNTEAAINTYLKNLPFNGVFRTTSLIDAMQKVTGFIDVKINQLEASVSYLIVPYYAPIDTLYPTVAGYMKIDPNFPLSNNITYMPYV